MKYKTGIRAAYDSLTPAPAQKARMLENILSSDPARNGKDVLMKRRKLKPLLIAAIIMLMVLLMGCAVIMLNLQDLKIGEHTIKTGDVQDSEGNVVEERRDVKDVISLQGLKDSPNQLAAKEWLEFYDAYDVDGQMIGDAEAAGYTAPREYDAYFVYDQTMQDKVDEIAEKYGLKLAGREAVVQSYQTEIFFDALGMDDLHHEDGAVTVEYGSGYFFACGNFDISFLITLCGEVSAWPYENLVSMRYCDKAYLDTVTLTFDDIESAEQWNYTTADGTRILIVMDGAYARYFCDREGAFISVSLSTEYRNGSGAVEHMPKECVELLANYLDFSVVPQKPDMDAAISALEQAEHEHQEAQEHASFWGYYDFIQVQITVMGDGANDKFYCLMDLNDDGADELILGNKDQIEMMWTMVDGQMNMIAGWDKMFKELHAAWPTMEKKPITEYSD